MPSSSRSLWLPLAGLILVLDGVAALLLSGVSLLFVNAVAAVEGRTGNPSAHLAWWALGFLVLGIGALVAGVSAIRRTRRGRRLGLLVALVTAVAIAASIVPIVTTTPIQIGAMAVAVAALVCQVVALVVLVNWAPPSPSSERHQESS